MTVTLELKADEVQVLQETAQAAGTTVEAVLHALIAQISLSRNAETSEVLADNSDALADKSDALAERRREQEEVEANIRRWHEERAPV